MTATHFSNSFRGQYVHMPGLGDVCREPDSLSAAVSPFEAKTDRVMAELTDDFIRSSDTWLLVGLCLPWPNPLFSLATASSACACDPKLDLTKAFCLAFRVVNGQCH